MVVPSKFSSAHREHLNGIELMKGLRGHHSLNLFTWAWCATESEWRGEALERDEVLL